jgi:hypothetical protein
LSEPEEMLSVWSDPIAARPTATLQRKPVAGKINSLRRTKPMTPNLLVKAVGLILLGVLFVHLWGMPWGLIAVAGIACLTLA